MSNIADRQRDSTLAGAYSIVRNLYSIVECDNAPEARLFLDELTKNINQHRSNLIKVEKFAYNLMSDRFNAYRPEPLKEQESSFFGKKQVETMKILETRPKIEDEKVQKKPTVKYPQQKRFVPGEKLKVFVEQAISPLEFYVIKEEDMDRRAEIEKLLAERGDSLIELPNTEKQDEPCAVLYKGNVYRGSISLNGKTDVLVCLVDHGSSIFISRSNMYALPEDLMLMSPPLAYHCSLADTDSRRVSNAIIMDFSLAIATNPQVEIFACGSLRQGNREVVYIPAQSYVRHEPKKIRKVPVIRSLSSNGEDKHELTCRMAQMKPERGGGTADGDWDEDEFPNLLDMLLCEETKRP